MNNNLFERLDRFKQLAEKSGMDEERELLKENMNKEAYQKQWMGRILDEIAVKEMNEDNKSTLNDSGVENKKGPELSIQDVGDDENRFARRSLSEHPQNIIDNRMTANFNKVSSSNEVVKDANNQDQ